MKLQILILFFIFSCSFKPMKDMNIFVNRDQLIKHVKALTSTPLPRNYINQESLNLTADYIDSVFSSFNSDVYRQNFDVSGQTYSNIICSFGPHTCERIIVGAHYDVFENQPGADDNASGVAGLLELARLISFYKPKLNHRIDLVAFCLEEPPFFKTADMGSARHAGMLKENNIDVKAMICLEMIGYFDDADNSQSFPVGFLKWFYPTTGNFIAVVSNLKSRNLASRMSEKMQDRTDLAVKKLISPSLLPGVDFSDHLNYWKNGYDAVMITDTAFFRNPHYHRTTDTAETLNYLKMAEVVKGVYYSIISL